MGIDLTTLEEQIQRRRREAKRQALEQSLGSGKTLVRVDTRVPGVRVPPRFEGEYALGLNLSWSFANADMRWNERGIAVTLSFSGTRFRCQLPWDSIWGYVPAHTQETKAWTMDLPPEMGGSRDPRDIPATALVEPDPEPVDPSSNVKRPQIRSWANWAEQSVRQRSSDVVRADDANSTPGAPAAVVGPDTPDVTPMQAQRSRWRDRSLGSEGSVLSDATGGTAASDDRPPRSDPPTEVKPPSSPRPRLRLVSPDESSDDG